jgi:hypothetical protein
MCKECVRFVKDNIKNPKYCSKTCRNRQYYLNKTQKPDEILVKFKEKMKEYTYANENNFAKVLKMSEYLNKKLM